MGTARDEVSRDEVSVRDEVSENSSGDEVSNDVSENSPGALVWLNTCS